MIAAIGALAFLLCLPGYSARAEDGDARDVTSSVTITIPMDSALIANMQDGDLETRALLGVSNGLRCTWRDDAEVSGLYLQLYTLPTVLTIVQTDAAGTELSRDQVTPLYNRYYPVSTEARGVRLTAGETSLDISELTFYSAGTLPADVQTWYPPASEPDVLLILNACGDEFASFGALLADLIEGGQSVSIIYMAQSSRADVQTTLDGLWQAGLKSAPAFLGFPSADARTYAETLTFWGQDASTGTIETELKRFRPFVAVSFSAEGNDARAFTGDCALAAVIAAASEPWGVQKLYLETAPGSGELTLAYSLVGEDTAETGVMENVDSTRELIPITETTTAPEATASPETAPVAEETAAPEQTAAADAPTASPGSSVFAVAGDWLSALWQRVQTWWINLFGEDVAHSRSFKIGMSAMLGVLILICLLLIFNRQKYRKPKAKRKKHAKKATETPNADEAPAADSDFSLETGGAEEENRS